ncbi:transposase [Paraburkholderia sp. RL17-347-BIC-D]|uniref:transposase n=1 Tax=Paraburkholderia sp. RL17-347-BIC-D TaxID=3031632 RepID=UPI0038B93F23
MKMPKPALAKVLKCLHYPLEVILTCVRWYVAYPLSPRHLEEMMAERRTSVDHSTVHRWVLKLLPVLEKAFRRRKRTVTIDKSGANLTALEAINADRETPIKTHQSRHLNNLVELDHRAIKRRTGPMLGFKTFRCVRILPGGIEVMHMIAKGQMKCARGTHPSAADQFYELAT